MLYKNRSVFFDTWNQYSVESILSLVSRSLVVNHDIAWQLVILGNFWSNPEVHL